MQVHTPEDDYVISMMGRNLCPDCQHELISSGQLDPYGRSVAQVEDLYSELTWSMFCLKCGWDESVWQIERCRNVEAAESELKKLNIDAF